MVADHFQRLPPSPCPAPYSLLLFLFFPLPQSLILCMYICMYPSICLSVISLHSAEALTRTSHMVYSVPVCGSVQPTSGIWEVFNRCLNSGYIYSIKEQFKRINFLHHLNVTIMFVMFTYICKHLQSPPLICSDILMMMPST